MSAISENIKKLRRKYDVTQSELARIAGVTENAVSKWENGYADPRMGAIERIAACYGLTKSNLIEENGIDMDFPLPPGAVPIKASEPAYLPYYGRVHAGDPMEADDIVEMVSVPAEIARNHPDAYSLDVMGDCMDKVVVPDIDRIFVDPNIQPQNGDIGVFLYDGELVLRRIWRGVNTVILSPDSYNPEHKDIVISGDEELISRGKMFWRQPKYEL